MGYTIQAWGFYNYPYRSLHIPLEGTSRPHSCSRLALEQRNKGSSDAGEI